MSSVYFRDLVGWGFPSGIMREDVRVALDWQQEWAWDDLMADHNFAKVLGNLELFLALDADSSKDHLIVHGVMAKSGD